MFSFIFFIAFYYRFCSYFSRSHWKKSSNKKKILCKMLESTTTSTTKCQNPLGAVVNVGKYANVYYILGIISLICFINWFFIYVQPQKRIRFQCEYRLVNISSVHSFFVFVAVSNAQSNIKIETEKVNRRKKRRKKKCLFLLLFCESALFVFSVFDIYNLIQDIQFR